MNHQFSNWTEQIRRLVDYEFENLINTAIFPDQIRSILNYLLLEGGKRLRPLLVFCCADNIDDSSSDIARCAAAVELIHISTLVHDDLPALDNDDYRRGRLSCHKVFGDGCALLVGDMLIPIALHLIVTSKLTDSKKVLATQIILESYRDVCIGQFFDIKGSSDSFQRLEELHRLKTGSLFRGAALLGGIISDKEIDLTKLGSFGERIGVNYQIMDDLIDLYGTESERGRPESSDRKNEKFSIFDSIEGRGEGEEVFLKNIESLNKDINLLFTSKRQIDLLTNYLKLMFERGLNLCREPLIGTP